MNKVNVKRRQNYSNQKPAETEVVYIIFRQEPFSFYLQHFDFFVHLIFQIFNFIVISELQKKKDLNLFSLPLALVFFRRLHYTNTKYKAFFAVHSSIMCRLRCAGNRPGFPRSS